MIPREFLGFIAWGCGVALLLALAVAEREHFLCHDQPAGPTLGSVKLYGC